MKVHNCDILCYTIGTRQNVRSRIKVSMVLLLFLNLIFKVLSSSHETVEFLSNDISEAKQNIVLDNFIEG